jgi:hypothetical protein
MFFGKKPEVSTKEIANNGVPDGSINLRPNRRGFLGLIGIATVIDPKGMLLTAPTAEATAAAIPTAISVGPIAEHLLHGKWGAIRSLPRLHEVIYRLGARVGDQDFPASEQFELAYNLADLEGLSIDQLSSSNLGSIQEGLSKKCQKAQGLLMRLEQFENAPGNSLSPDDLEEINLLFLEPFSYLDVDVFRDIRNEADTPHELFNSDTEKKYRDNPLELVQQPDYRPFIQSQLRKSLREMQARKQDVSKVLKFAEEFPSSLLGRILLKRDDRALQELLELGKQLQSTYSFRTGGSGGLRDHLGYSSPKDLEPRYGLSRFQRDVDVVTREKLNDDQFSKMQACTQAFIFRYGPDCSVDSAQPMAAGAKRVVEALALLMTGVCNGKCV